MRTNANNPWEAAISRCEKRFELLGDNRILGELLQELIAYCREQLKLGLKIAKKSAQFAVWGTVEFIIDYQMQNRDLDNQDTVLSILKSQLSILKNL